MLPGLTFDIVVSIIVGGLISAAISLYFARQASSELTRATSELKAENASLQLLINTLAQALFRAGAMRSARSKPGSRRSAYRWTRPRSSR